MEKDQKLMDNNFPEGGGRGVLLEEKGSGYCSNNYVNGKKRLNKWCNNIREEKGSLVNIRGGNGFIVFLKKIGIFLTISLALCTMWVNHNIIPS